MVHAHREFLINELAAKNVKSTLTTRLQLGMGKVKAIVAKQKPHRRACFLPLRGRILIRQYQRIVPKKKRDFVN